MEQEKLGISDEEKAIAEKDKLNKQAKQGKPYYIKEVELE